MADIEKVNTIAISDIEEWNGLTDAEIEKLNAINWSGSFAIGTWTAEGNGLGSNKFSGATMGTGGSGLYAGGYSPGRDASFEWDGTSWSSGGTMNNGAWACMGAGTQSDALKIAGQDAENTYQYVETYNGSSWTSKTATNNDHSQGTVGGGGAVNSCIVILGANANSEVYNSSGSGSWTTKATDTRRDEMMGGHSGGGGEALAIAGVDQPGDGSILSTVRKYTLSGDAWSNGTAIPTATKAGGAFGQTDATDVVAFTGETAASGDSSVGTTIEFNNGAWQTGNNITRPRRTLTGGGPTGNGLVAGGYDGSYRDYTDTFDRTVST